MMVVIMDKFTQYVVKTTEINKYKKMIREKVDLSAYKYSLIRNCVVRREWGTSTSYNTKKISDVGWYTFSDSGKPHINVSKRADSVYNTLIELYLIDGVNNEFVKIGDTDFKKFRKLQTIRVNDIISFGDGTRNLFKVVDISVKGRKLCVLFESLVTGSRKHISSIKHKKYKIYELTDQDVKDIKKEAKEYAKKMHIAMCKANVDFSPRRRLGMQGPYVGVFKSKKKQNLK